MPRNEGVQGFEPPTSNRTNALPRARLTFLGIAAGLIATGLTLRLGPWKLPLIVHHSGGGYLWGGLIYASVATIRPLRWRCLRCFLVASAIIVGVESMRLVHTPDLDSFRLTLAGQWLLGLVFSPWNILVDILGALSVALLTMRSI